MYIMYIYANRYIGSLPPGLPSLRLVKKENLLGKPQTDPLGKGVGKGQLIKRNVLQRKEAC